MLPGKLLFMLSGLFCSSLAFSQTEGDTSRDTIMSIQQARIEKLQTSVDQLLAEVSAAKTLNKTLQKDLDATKTSLASVQQKIASLPALTLRVDKLDEKLPALKVYVNDTYYTKRESDARFSLRPPKVVDRPVIPGK